MIHHILVLFSIYILQIQIDLDRKDINTVEIWIIQVYTVLIHLYTDFLIQFCKCALMIFKITFSSLLYSKNTTYNTYNLQNTLISCYVINKTLVDIRRLLSLRESKVICLFLFPQSVST